VSKQANPFAVGAFLVGALMLLTAAVMVFGGSDFFKHKKRFVIFFESGLNGLNIGAPVKLQGVQIGNVAEISLEMDAASGRIFKPVVIEIEPGLLRDFSGQPVEKHSDHARNEDAQRMIDAGLKARLETQNLLTGLLYVDLNFYHDKPVMLVNLDYKDLPELPSVPSTVDEIRNIADEIINKVQHLPLEQMVKDLSETFQEARDLIKSDDTKTSIKALAKSLQETQALMLTLNAQIGPLLQNVNTSVTETRSGVKDLNKQLAPVLKAAEQSLNTTTLVLQDSQQTMRAFETLATPDSPLGQALLEMRDAARALHDLAESLERQPDELLYGKH
jgi:paraquat-inducible protein B